MNNNEQYWCDEQLSRMLEELGCESQFDMHICENDPEPHEPVLTDSNSCYVDWHDEKGIFHSKEDYGYIVYHWSDICLPENAKKIFIDENQSPYAVVPFWKLMSTALFRKIQNKSSWQQQIFEQIKIVLKSKK